MNAPGVTLPHQSICVTCLSQDRKLCPVNTSKCHASLLNLAEGDKLCWECNCFLRKMTAFQRRAARAQALLTSALYHPDVTKISSLSSLIMTPVCLDIVEPVDPLQVILKAEIIKEERDNGLYECRIEDTCTRSNNESRDESFEEIYDERLLPVFNEQSEAKGDEEACGEEMGDEKDNLELLSKNLLDKRQEHPCKLEPGREADATPELGQVRAGDGPARSQTLQQQVHLGSGFVGLERIPLGVEQTSSFTIPVTFDCNLKRRHDNQQATPYGGHVHASAELSSLCTPIQTQMAATAVEIRDNRLAPIMRQRLVPARGLGRGRGATATGRGAPAAGSAEWGGAGIAAVAAGWGAEAAGWEGAAAGRDGAGRGAVAAGRGAVAAGRGGVGKRAAASGRGGGKPNQATPVKMQQKTAKLPRILPEQTPAGSPTGPADKPADTQTHTRPKGSKRSPKPWYFQVLKKHEVAAERREMRNSEEFAEAEFRCEPCVETFASAAAVEAHAKLHLASAGPFACDVCTQRVGSVKELNAHHALHSFRYHCCHCRYTTPHKQIIVKHTCDKQEQQQESESAQCPEVRGRRPRRRYPKPIRCKHCFVGFSHDAALAQHVAKNHTEPPVPAECKECGKMFPNKYFLKRHSYLHGNKDLEGFRQELFCAECNMLFVNTSAYRFHRNSLKHSNKDSWQYECDYCGKKCQTKGTVAAHIKAVHIVDRKYKCSQCPKAYVTRWQLKQHALSHSPDSRPRPHVCDQCGKAFLTKGTLREHMNIHNGLRLYACEHCPATFSFSAAAYTHNRLKHLKIKRGSKKKGPKKKVDKKEVESVDNEELDGV